MIFQTLVDVGLLVAGAGLLWKGADWVVHSACRLAHRFGLPDAVVGASVVALGTSAPELTVSVLAALRGQPDIAVANIVGSNIFNLGIILGLGGVLGGAHLLVGSASDLARLMGISDWAVGVTIVAAGTSLPELATALIAAHRGRMGMLAGTLVGSDIFNLLGVVGLTALLHPLAVSHEVHEILMLMTAMVTILIVLMRTGWRLARAEGLVLIAIGLLRWWRDLQ